MAKPKEQPLSLFCRKAIRGQKLTTEKREKFIKKCALQHFLVGNFVFQLIHANALFSMQSLH